MSLSWLHHKGRNRHHFEYWIDYRIARDGTVSMGGCKMPKKYVAEMFCDRIAACRVYQGDQYTDASAYDYFQRTKGRFWIHEETSALLGRWLLLLKEEGGGGGLPPDSPGAARLQNLLRAVFAACQKNNDRFLDVFLAFRCYSL